jgi:hypothetical protein
VLVGAAIAPSAGCGDDPPRGETPNFGHPPPVRDLPGDAQPTPQPPPLKPPRCPPEAGNCAEATGTVFTLEAVDPDGDGDAHLILLSPQSITAPGISVIDVERSLRPHPLPEPGDRVAAAGPVYTGSYGQRQIQATELRVSRSGG